MWSGYVIGGYGLGGTTRVLSDEGREGRICVVEVEGVWKVLIGMG